MKIEPNIDPTAAEIRVAVQNAFKNSRPPASVGSSTDLPPESIGSKIRAVLRVDHWIDLDVLAIQAMDTGWHALSLEQQHYFLPAYLIATLDDKKAEGLGGWTYSFSVELMLCGDPKWDAEAQADNEAFRNTLSERQINALRMVFRYWRKVGLIDDERYAEYIDLYRNT